MYRTLTLSFKTVQQDQSVTDCLHYLDTDNKANVYSTLTLNVLLVVDTVLLGLVTHRDSGQPDGHPLEAGLGTGDLNGQERDYIRLETFWLSGPGVGWLCHSTRGTR